MARKLQTISPVQTTGVPMQPVRAGKTQMKVPRPVPRPTRRPSFDSCPTLVRPAFDSCPTLVRPTRPMAATADEPQVVSLEDCALIELQGMDLVDVEPDLQETTGAFVPEINECPICKGEMRPGYSHCMACCGRQAPAPEPQMAAPPRSGQSVVGWLRRLVAPRRIAPKEHEATRGNV